MKLTVAVIAAVLAMPIALSAVRGAGVGGIVIDTDRSVNCATLETIVRDVTAGTKTDQDKAVAMYNFMVRMMWIHYAYDLPKEMVGGRLRSVTDPLKNLNVYGAGGCGIQSVVFSTLLKAAGLEPRQLAPGFAHISNEVKWDGKWHWMDVWLPLYLTNEKGEIYSYDELMANRELIDQAVKAGRHSANFMFNPAPDSRTMKKAKPHRALGPGTREVNYVEDLTLREGESCTWLWDNVGKWYWPGEKFAFPAFKFPADKNCKQAFPYWEPYRKDLSGGPHPWSKVYYRYYANAVFRHDVPLSAERLAGWGAKLTNVAFADGGGIRPAGAGQATVEIPFKLPYIIADSEVSGTRAAGGGQAPQAQYSIDAGKTWKRFDLGAGKAFGPVSIGKPNAREYPAGTTTGQYGFLLRLVLSGDAALTGLRVVNTTMLNFYSRPWLEVGANKVTVTARNPDALAKTPLEITWRWLEDWTREKSHTHKVARSGATCVIEAGGTKRPKMKSITIACPARP